MVNEGKVASFTIILPIVIIFFREMRKFLPGDKREGIQALKSSYITMLKPSTLSSHHRFPNRRLNSLLDIFWWTVAVSCGVAANCNQAASVSLSPWNEQT